MGKKYDEKNGKVSVSYRVSPIKKQKDIEKIKQYFMGHASKRNYALFVVGINVGLRASDLTKLLIGDVYDLDKSKVKDSVRVVEQKTGKEREFVLNKAAQDAIALYLSERGTVAADDWLFLSQKRGKLSVKSVNRLIRDTCKELGIKGRYGSHTLRKTFGYHAYMKNIQSDPGFINTLQVLLNHSSARTTLRYIDIDREKIADVYKDLNL